MRNGELIKDIRDRMVAVFINDGFIVQLYDAFSTNSAYIKLDYGLMNSIRISDHHGKDHLCYRYNIILDEPDNIVEEKYMRYYFNQFSWDKLVQQIRYDRILKQQKYKRSYDYFMLKNKLEHENDTKGFWTHAKTLNDNRTEDEWNAIKRRYELSHPTATGNANPGPRHSGSAQVLDSWGL